MRRSCWLSLWLFTKDLLEWIRDDRPVEWVARDPFAAIAAVDGARHTEDVFILTGRADRFGLVGGRCGHVIPLSAHSMVAA